MSDMRTPLRRVRGMGSAHGGTDHFWQQRLTAISNFNITGWIRSLAGQASGILSGSVLVILFVGFMFAEQVWFPVKVERLTGDAAQARQVTRIISSIMHRVNRYLVVKTGVSAVTAVIVWMIFKLAGLELAVAVAILTFILNFIPSVGSIARISTAAGWPLRKHAMLTQWCMP